jgi:hypothetical protein
LAKPFDERIWRARAPPGGLVDASSLQVCQGSKSVAIAPRYGIPIPDLARTLTSKAISAPCRGGGIICRCPRIGVALIPLARPAGLSNVSPMVTCITVERRIGQISSIRYLLSVGVLLRRSIGNCPIATGIPSGSFATPGWIGTSGKIGIQGVIAVVRVFGPVSSLVRVEPHVIRGAHRSRALTEKCGLGEQRQGHEGKNQKPEWELHRVGRQEPRRCAAPGVRAGVEISANINRSPGPCLRPP